jgi:YHS domain-containing protein
MKVFILYIIMSVSLYSCTPKSAEQVKEKPSRSRNQAYTLANNGIDPICKMDVKINLFDTLNHEGKVYGFCSEPCKEAYAKKLKRSK